MSFQETCKHPRGYRVSRNIKLFYSMLTVWWSTFSICLGVSINFVIRQLHVYVNLYFREYYRRSRISERKNAKLNLLYPLDIATNVCTWDIFYLHTSLHVSIFCKPINLWSSRCICTKCSYYRGLSISSLQIKIEYRNKLFPVFYRWIKFLLQRVEGIRN